MNVKFMKWQLEWGSRKFDIKVETTLILQKMKQIRTSLLIPPSALSVIDACVLVMKFKEPLLLQ
jgi:hypothetical protein